MVETGSADGVVLSRTARDDPRVRYLLASGVEMEFPADTSRIVEADYAPLTVTAGFGYRF